MDMLIATQNVGFSPIKLFLDADLDRGVLAGTEGETGIGEIGFDEHGARGVVEGIGEA